MAETVDYPEQPSAATGLASRYCAMVKLLTGIGCVALSVTVAPAFYEDGGLIHHALVHGLTAAGALLSVWGARVLLHGSDIGAEAALDRIQCAAQGLGSYRQPRSEAAQDVADAVVAAIEAAAQARGAHAEPAKLTAAPGPG